MKLESLPNIIKSIELEPEVYEKILKIRGLLIANNLPENYSIKFHESTAMIEVFSRGFYINNLYFTFDGYEEK